MMTKTSTGKELARGAGAVVGHTIAIVAGVGLMIAGVAMGVTLVLLPIGIPVGLAGLGVCLWGLFGRKEQAETPT